MEKKATEFIDELAKHIIDELSRDLGDFARLQAKFNKLKTLAEKSLSSSEDACNDIAYLLYFTGSFQNPFVGKQALEWLLRNYSRLLWQSMPWSRFITYQVALMSSAVIPAISLFTFIY
jgi:hypothetical protein